MRPSLALLAIVGVALPSIARAQQQPIPPTGEPPPPETRMAEKAAIEQQVTQTYVASHQQELQSQAANEVDNERRAAWQQRGQENIPPAIIAKLPTIEAGVISRFGSVGGNTASLGISGTLQLRLKHWWGLEATGGIVSLHDFDQNPPSVARLGAAFTDFSVLAWLPTGGRRFINADHVVFRLGLQTLFPLREPTLTDVHLTPFVGIGTVFTFGTFARGKAYVGCLIESRFGYRFTTGPSSPIKGGVVDILSGPVVGF